MVKSERNTDTEKILGMAKEHEEEGKKWGKF